MGSKGLGKGFGLGQGQGPLRQGFRNNATNFNINPQHVVEEIRKLLDKLPEVKNAKGTINVTFADGKTSTLNLSYN